METDGYRFTRSHSNSGSCFLCFPVKAAEADPTVPTSATRLLFSFDEAQLPLAGTDTELYLYCDVIFTSNALTSGQIYFDYDTTLVRYSFGPHEGYGPYNIYSNNTYTKNSRTYRRIVIDFANTSYFVYRFVLRGNQFSQQALDNPATMFDIKFGSQNLTYGDVIYSDMYQYNMMNYYLQSIASGQASVVSAMQSVDGTLQDILDEVQQINQSLTQQQQQQISNLDNNMDSLNNNVTQFGNLEEGMNIMFDTAVNQFNTKSGHDAQSINTMLYGWGQELTVLRTLYEDFFMVPHYLFFLVIPLVMIVLKE